jgi:PAS domain S-box-containing protein
MLKATVLDPDPLVHALPWPVAAVDRSGTVVAVSRSWVELGHTDARAIEIVEGDSLLDLCVDFGGRDADDVHELQSALRALLVGDTSEASGLACPCHVGPNNPSCRLRLVAVPEHATVKALLIHEDLPITESRLSDLETRCRLVADVVRAWGFIAAVERDGSYHVTWCTDSGHEGFSGFSAAELRARGGWLATVVLEDRPSAEEQIGRVLHGRADERYLRTRGRDGKVRWVRSMAQPIWSRDEQRVVEIVGAVQDVTEWRNVQDDLRLHADIFHHIDLGLVVWRLDDGSDEQFRLVSANPAASRLTGIDLELMVGVELYQIFPDARRHEFGSLLRRVIDGKSAITEVELEYASGDVPRMLAIKMFRLPERCVGVAFDDVTERRQLQTRMRQVEKMETVGRLAGGLAHDFNNVLTTIMGSASMLDETLMPGDPRRDALRDILDASERGAGMTKRLLTIARKQPSQAQVLQLNEIVSGLQNLLRRVVGVNVDLRVTLDPAVPPVMADPTELEQVLLNLAVNARQAMPNGGVLTVTTRQSSGSAELVVRDTGIGMDAATQARVFEPFFTTKSDGTGLGLATVYGIVSRSGGEIALDSTPGQGTAFTVRFPAAADNHNAPSRPAVAMGLPPSL